MNYFLDTNSLWYLLDSISKSKNIPLEPMLKDENGNYTFTISEITSLEIYSVLGKNGRGSSLQKNICTRKLKSDGSIECGQEWFELAKKKISNPLLQQYAKLIHDMEAGRGFIKTNIIKIDTSTITKSRNLLTKYAGQYDFQSLDSLVTASFLEAKIDDDWTIVTSDKKLQNVLKQENLTIYDSLKGTTI